MYPIRNLSKQFLYDKESRILEATENEFTNKVITIVADGRWKKRLENCVEVLMKPML